MSAGRCDEASAFEARISLKKNLNLSARACVDLDARVTARMNDVTFMKHRYNPFKVMPSNQTQVHGSRLRVHRAEVAMLSCLATARSIIRSLSFGVQFVYAIGRRVAGITDASV